MAQTTRSPWAKLAFALLLFGAVAGKSWWDRTHARPALPLPPVVESGDARSVSAWVIKVVDGDTFDARVELRPHMRIRARVRLRGVDAPELHAACKEELIGAEAAQRALQAILAEGDVTLRDLGEDKYGRLLGSVATRATPDVSEALIKRGVARRYYGGHRYGWC